MMNSQTQSLLLQRNKGRRALLAPRNFPFRSPKARIHRHGAPTYSPTGGGHGAPDAVSQTPREGLVRRDSVRSLAHVPMWVASGSTAALRREAHPAGLAVSPVRARGEAGGLTVMLHF